MFATKEGTTKFMQESIAEAHTHSDHFKEVQGLYFSSLGLGTYLGEPNATDDQRMQEVIKFLLRSKLLNVIDTAINYRFQRSEKVIGTTLNELISNNELEREEIIISTKGGYVAPGEPKYYHDISEYLYSEIIHSNICRKEDVVNGIHSMSPGFLEFELYESLKNLKVETIDIYYLHNAAEEQLSQININEFYDQLLDVFIFFEKMRDIRKIQWYGMATWDSFRVLPNNPHYISLEKVVNIAKEAGGENHGFKFIQLPFNFLYHQAVSLKNQYVKNTQYTLCDAAQQLDVNVVVSAPLLQGRLLSSDHYPRFNNIMSIAQNAIQFARSAHPNIATVLVGMKSIEHCKENLQVSKLPKATAQEVEESFKNI